MHQFPHDKWSQLIHTQLTGKALKVFADLTVSECQDYEVLKNALLLTYARVPEYHRKRFHTHFKGSGESYCNFAFRLLLPFKSWLECKEAFENLDQLKEVVQPNKLFTDGTPLEGDRKTSK